MTPDRRASVRPWRDALCNADRLGAIFAGAVLVWALIVLLW